MKASPRIGFDARYINDRYHGIGRYAFRLLESNITQAPGFAFVVFHGQGTNRRFNLEGLRAHPNVELRPGPWPIHYPQEQLRWLPILRASRVDLFHSPYITLPWFTSVPGIITVHDLIFDRCPEYMPQPWARPYYRLMMAWGTRRARRLITVSEATAADLYRFYNPPPEKTRVLSEGTDPHFKPEESQEKLQALARRYHLERPFMLTVGARRPHKNHRRLVQAYARLAADISHDLVFAGPPDERFPDEARQTAEALRLDRRVRFLDWVPEEDLPGIYSLSDLVVLPSEIEGFGLPALEAMACGKPVVAASNSAFPEVVGDAGELVNPYDEVALAALLLRLLRDESRRRRMGQAGLERAASFNWPDISREIIQIYQELLP